MDFFNRFLISLFVTIGLLQPQLACTSGLHVNNIQQCKPCDEHERIKAYEVMANYINYGSVATSGSGVTRESMTKFEVLFQQNALVYNDVRTRDHGQILIYEYITQISENFPKTGLNIDYSKDAYLFLLPEEKYFQCRQSLSESGYPTCEYQMAIRKTMRTGIDERHRNTNKSRTVDLRILISVSQRTGLAKIVEIEKF